MQISGNYNLPAISHVQADRLDARRAQERHDAASQELAQAFPEQRPQDRSNTQTHRRPPLYLQSMDQNNLSRTGEQALRAYQGAAQAGGREELVNRIHEMA